MNPQAPQTVTRSGQITTWLISSGLASRAEIVGCSRTDLETVSEHFRTALPLGYFNFLSECGRAAGAFMRGEGIFFPRLLKARLIAEELLAQDECSELLAPGFIVFYQHDGYEFWCLDCRDEVPDPPVHYYVESSRRLDKVSGCFSDFLFAMVQEFTHLVAKPRQHPK